MFCKAKIKRFNEDVSCAPSPTQYDPKMEKNSRNISLDRTSRFRDSKETAPFTYIGPIISSLPTPTKTSKSGSVPRLNTSIVSTSSSSSQSSFLTPSTLIRSKSCHSKNFQSQKQNVLQKKIDTLISEKKELQESVLNLEAKLEKLKIEKNESSETRVDKLTFCDSSTQIDSVESLETEDEQPEDLTCHKRNTECVSMTAEELQLLKDQIDHLTMLRDNLESSVALKDDTITDLQLQIDLIVAEAEDGHDEMQTYKEEVVTFKNMFYKSCEEKNLIEHRVQDLMNHFETLMHQREYEQEATKGVIAQKDIEIELMNDSIATLSAQISEYECIITEMRSMMNTKKIQISSLESTVSDLSISSKEKEVMETVLEDEINESKKEINGLIVNLGRAEDMLKVKNSEKYKLLSAVEKEKCCSVILKEKLEILVLSMKEKEVVQQFLEKEVASREAEVSQATSKVSNLEKELETANLVAVDMQLQAEEQLNSMIGVNASLSVKEFDIEKKDDVILSLKERVAESELFHSQVIQNCDEKSSKITELDADNALLKSSLANEQENTAQLEGRLVELMAEVEDRDNELQLQLEYKVNEVEEIAVKYSDALLDQENSRRMLSAATENLEKEKLLLEATERELESVKTDFTKQIDNSFILEASVRELSHKLVHLEDALACEEAAAAESQERLRLQIKSSHQQVDNLKLENASLQSSNEGFMGQINQLKIDMAKKSIAVDDLKGRIDEFRNETNELQISYLRIKKNFADKEIIFGDLQNEFESRLHVITHLQDRLDEAETELESLQINTTLNYNKIQQEKNDVITLLSQAQKSLEEEKEISKYHESELNCIESQAVARHDELKAIFVEECQRSARLSHELDDLRTNYEDQVNNMQASLLDKTTEAQKLEQSYLEVNESYRSKVELLQGNIDLLVKDTDQLSSSLASKDELLSNLNQSVSIKSDQIETLQINLDTKQKMFSAIESRVKEMELTMDSLKNERDQSTNFVSSLQSSLDVSTKQLTKLTEDSECDINTALQLTDLRIINISLREEADTWKTKFEYLKKIIEPFREQLDSYELEKASLLSKSCAAEEEVSKLSSEYAKLLGHNNHKQKIQHVVKLKTENNELREKVQKLQLEVEKLKKSLKRLEERNEGAVRKTKPTKDNKENASEFTPVVNNTPLRPANHYRRL